MCKESLCSAKQNLSHGRTSGEQLRFGQALFPGCGSSLIVCAAEGGRTGSVKEMKNFQLYINNGVKGIWHQYYRGAVSRVEGMKNEEKRNTDYNYYRNRIRM